MNLRRSDPSVANRKINVQTSSPHLEKVLRNYEELIGADYEGYRNHIYRVLTYSLHFLDGDKTQDGKVLKYLPLIEAALVYHDIGLWTDRRLSYLEPSSFRAKQEFEGMYSETELELLHNIIYWHHKVTPFVGENAEIVNAVRKADWIDATFGAVNHGMPRHHINAVNAALAEAGFHNMLAGIGPRYYGNDVLRIVTELSSIFKW
jgi:hypothetical protein